MSFPLKPVVGLQDVRELEKRPFKMAIMSAAIKKMVSGLVVLLLLSPLGIKAGELPPYAKVPKITAVAAAYKAKILCSAVFVSKRNPSDAQQQELKDLPFPAKIDEQNKTVTVAVGMGMPDQIAIFRDGLGCTLGSRLHGRAYSCSGHR